MAGELAILNVGAGDTKLTFDGDPAEVEKNARIVEDMIRRGFVLLIEVGSNDKGPIYQRAKAFDPETLEYIVAGTTTEGTGHEEAAAASSPKERKPAARPQTRGAAKARTSRVPARTARAVGVARTAGG